MSYYKRIAKMKKIFIFGLRSIKKSTSKAASGMENRIIRLTSKVLFRKIFPFRFNQLFSYEKSYC